ncbi:MAG: response regulator [Thaumarchaeota archaeon]|nr:response regulator [Nitrososphaerota archaeon]
MSRKFPIVLIIDDSQSFRLFTKEVIKKTIKWVRVFGAKDGLEGLKLYQHCKPDLILLDLNMPKLHGSKVLEVIMKNDSDVKVIITTAYDDNQETISHLIKMGACNFLAKPMNRMTLMKTITDTLYSRKIAVTHNQISKLAMSE